MFKTITGWFTSMKEEMNDLSQQQREAELDLLILMMYADRHIDDKERDAIVQESKSFVWENKEYHVTLYIDKTIAKVRSVMLNEKSLNLFLEDILTRLNDKETRDKALESVEKFMDIDFDISYKERELLEVIKKVFKH